MKKHMALLRLVAVLLAWLAPCAGPLLGAVRQSAPGAAAAAPHARPVTITIYATGDLHDHSANLPQIAHFVRERRKSNPNILFVDVGDIWNKGEPQMQATGGEGMVRLMSKCGYDAWIPGNHDYLYGIARVFELSRKYPAFPLVISNLRREGELAAQTRHIPSHKVFEFEGRIRLGLVAGACHYLNHAKGRIPIYPARDAFKNLVPELRKSCAVVVAITHLTDSDDCNILDVLGKENAPDVIIGGHTHQAANRRIGGTLLVKGSAMGNELVQVTIVCTTGGRVETSAKLLPVGRDWPLDETVAAMRAGYFAARKPAASR